MRNKHLIQEILQVQKFMIVHAESMSELNSGKLYKFRKTAQNACDKLNAQRALLTLPINGKPIFVVYSQEEYAVAIEGKGEWRVSAYDGVTKIWVPLGTPMCCDPSTETYWSM